MDKEAVVQSGEFQDFLTKTSRLVERALFVDSKFDITVDYGKSDAEDERWTYRVFNSHF